MPDIETKPACRAVIILTEQYKKDRDQQAQLLAEIALESAGLSQADGWVYNINDGCYQRPKE